MERTRLNSTDPAQTGGKSLLAAAANGRSSGFTVGFDMRNYTAKAGHDAGIMNWGSVPDDAYIGNM